MVISEIPNNMFEPQFQSCPAYQRRHNTMTNPDTMAVPPSNSSGLIRLRLSSQAITNSSAQPTCIPQDSSPQLQALEQSLRQLIQSFLETAIMVHDLGEGSGELLFQKMYPLMEGMTNDSDELT